MSAAALEVASKWSRRATVLHCIATEGFVMSNAPKGALDTTPYWAASLSSPAFERLAHDECIEPLEVDRDVGELGHSLGGGGATGHR